VRKGDNLPPSCAVVTKSGNLNFLEPCGPVQACNGTALPFFMRLPNKGFDEHGYLTFRHHASYIYVGQAYRYSPEYAFYIFSQQIYYLIIFLDFHYLCLFLHKMSCIS